MYAPESELRGEKQDESESGDEKVPENLKDQIQIELRYSVGARRDYKYTSISRKEWKKKTSSGGL